MDILKNIKIIENIINLKKKQREGLNFLLNLQYQKKFSSNELFEIIYLCIDLYYSNSYIEEKYEINLKRFYLKSAEKFLSRYFNIKGDSNIFTSNEDVLMLIELAACFSIECLYGKSTELLMNVIENPFVNKDLKKRALEELFFESEKFLPQKKIIYYKKLYNELIEN